MEDKISMWKNCKTVMFPTYGLAVITFVLCIVILLPPAVLFTKKEAALWVALGGSFVMAIFVPLMASLLNLLSKARMIQVGGFFPVLNESEKPLLIGRSRKPVGLVFLTTERLVVRQQEISQKATLFPEWKDIESFKTSDIKKVEPRGTFGGFEIMLADGSHESLKMPRRSVWIRLLRK